jgi:hypothetical protein
MMSLLSRRAPKPKKVLSGSEPPEAFLPPEPAEAVARSVPKRQKKHLTLDDLDNAKLLAEQGVPMRCIAAVIGVSCAVLARRAMRVLVEGQQVANANVVKALYRKAAAGDTTCMIFWCKTQLGWKDSNPVQMIGNVNYDGHEKSSNMNTPLSINEIERLERICDRIEWNGNGDSPPPGGLLS